MFVMKILNDDDDYFAKVFNEMFSGDIPDRCNPPPPPKLDTKGVKVLIIGYAQHGKDTFGEKLCELTGMVAKDSSRTAISLCVRKDLESIGINYTSDEECYADRKNHRDIWFRSISNYNKEDPLRLTREVLRESDIYIGMRDERELLASRAEGVFDLIFWVDASGRKSLETSDSMTIVLDEEMLYIDNNRTLSHLDEEVAKAAKVIELHVDFERGVSDIFDKVKGNA